MLRNRILGLAFAFNLALVPMVPTIAAPVTPGPQSGTFLPLDAPIDSDIPEIAQALSAFRQREYEKCLQLLREANKKHPETPAARLVLAKLFLSENMIPQGKLTLEGACVDSPNDPEIYILFGRLALADNRASDANLNFEKATALIEGAKLTDEQKKILQRESLLGLATVQEARQDWKTAEQTLRKLIDLMPDVSAPRQRLATALFFLDKPDAAFGELETATKLDPQMAPPAIGMAWLFTQKKNYEQAEQWMRKAVEQHPDDGRSHANFAQWLVQRDRAKEAEQFIKNALGKDSQSVGFLRLRGEIARLLKDYAEAEKVFSDLTARYPAEVVYSNLLALALIEQPDLAKHQRAREYAESNYQRYKNQADVLSTLGRVYYKFGRIDDADKALRQALATGRGTSETAYYLGEVAADRGRVEEAREMFKKAVATPGPFVFRQEATERLKSLEAAAGGVKPATPPSP